MMLRGGTAVVVRRRYGVDTGFKTCGGGAGLPIADKGHAGINIVQDQIRLGRGVNEFDPVGHRDIACVGKIIRNANLARCACGKIEPAQFVPVTVVDLLIDGNGDRAAIVIDDMRNI